MCVSHRAKQQYVGNDAICNTPRRVVLGIAQDAGQAAPYPSIPLSDISLALPVGEEDQRDTSDLYDLSQN